MTQLILTSEEHRRGEDWLLSRLSRILTAHQLQELPGLSEMSEAEIPSLPGFPEPAGRIGAVSAFHLDDFLAWWRVQQPEQSSAAD